MAKLTKLEDIVSLCKRRGFIFQSSEIYGGLASCYDYGPLGVELKNNVKKAWWKSAVQMRDDVVGLDCSILMHPMVWKSSGHADHFSDLIAECKKCNTRTRVDHLTDNPEQHTEHVPVETAMADAANLGKKVCPNCGKTGQFTEPMPFKLMFEFACPKDECFRGNFVPETFSNLRDAERDLNACRIEYVFEIYKNSLCSFRPHI